MTKEVAIQAVDMALYGLEKFADLRGISVGRLFPRYREINQELTDWEFGVDTPDGVIEPQYDILVNDWLEDIANIKWMVEAIVAQREALMNR